MACRARCCRIAVQLDPKLALVYLVRGEAYLGRKDYESAIRDFDEAVRLDPKRPWNFIVKARLFGLKGDYKSARTDFCQTVERFPQSADAHNSLAWFLATCPDAAYRNGAEAVKHARSACELTEWKDAAELDTLAAAYAEAGDFDQAVEFMTQALSKMGPEDAADREEFEGRLALFQRKEAYRAKPGE